MGKEIATSRAAAVTETSPLLDGDRFAAMFRLAEAMARAKTLPAHLHNNAGDCLRVVEYAHRCGYSPFALADCTFLVGGKMGWEGKAVAAMVNASPRVNGSLRYAYDGKGDERRVTVSGRLHGESEDRTVDATVKQGLSDSKGARERWQKDPDQMLAYYGARRWARRHAPEVLLGIYTADELLAGVDEREMVDITPRHDEPAAEEHEVAAEPTSEPPPEPDQDPADQPDLLDEPAETPANIPAAATKLRRDIQAALDAGNHDGAVRLRMQAAAWLPPRIAEDLTALMERHNGRQ